MKIEKFKRLFKNCNGFYLTDDVILFRKPLELWNTRTNESVEFKNIEECLRYTLQDGQTVREIIYTLNDLSIPAIDGGRGASAGGKMQIFSFGHARDNGKDKTESLLPAYANVRIKSKTFEGALKEFSDKYGNAKKEWAYEVDSQGYVHQYKSGNRTSVSIGGTNKDHMILHNHPSGSAFSDSDLLSAALDNSKGVVASGKYGSYIFQKKGGHFKANAFTKAVKTAKMKGRTYDEAVDKWLKANAKKYGYQYEFRKK